MDLDNAAMEQSLADGEASALRSSDVLGEDLSLDDVLDSIAPNFDRLREVDDYPHDPAADALRRDRGWENQSLYHCTAVQGKRQESRLAVLDLYITACIYIESWLRSHNLLKSSWTGSRDSSFYKCCMLKFGFPGSGKKVCLPTLQKGPLSCYNRVVHGRDIPPSIVVAVQCADITVWVEAYEQVRMWARLGRSVKDLPSWTVVKWQGGYYVSKGVCQMSSCIP